MELGVNIYTVLEKGTSGKYGASPVGFLSPQKLEQVLQNYNLIIFIAMMYTNGSKDSLDSRSCCMPKVNYHGHARLTS